MTFYARSSVLLSFTSVLALVISMSAYAEVDVDATNALAKKSSCFKCHAVDKDKEGSAYKKVAEKYRGQADAEEKLVIHATTGKREKFPDGHEDEHQIVKTQDMAEIKNLVDWILSLQNAAGSRVIFLRRVADNKNLLIKAGFVLCSVNAVCIYP